MRIFIGYIVGFIGPNPQPLSKWEGVRVSPPVGGGW